ncbi:hypothetical protein V494_03837 [Pseudogymnoascus sp. VKM F-4513 (FW-928)]|nr:hypothetical protein V494_03837 [Pseudogymnoascus sp. VKM F-4513 (FW-928)]
MADFEAVAKQFTEYYYNQFDTDRSQLAPLYRDNSMLTFESAAVAGAGPIVEKLTSLPFAKVKHQVSTLDAQPVEGGGIIILVTGALLVDEEQRPMNYSQCFQLLPNGQGSYFIFNDIFKLVFATRYPIAFKEISNDDDRRGIRFEEFQYIRAMVRDSLHDTLQAGGSAFREAQQANTLSKETGVVCIFLCFALGIANMFHLSIVILFSALCLVSSFIIIFVEIPLLMRICPTSSTFDSFMQRFTTNYMRALIYFAMAAIQWISIVAGVTSLIAAAVLLTITSALYALAGVKGQAFTGSKTLGGQGVAQMIV